jgi:serine/threonine protein kinase
VSSSTAPHGDTLPHAVRCASCGAHSPAGHQRFDGCGRLLRISAMREPGTILGSYRLIEVLGEGGMGVVYLAEHTKLGRRVAVKMLRSEYSENPQAVHRFFAEARAVNKINHQNIVEITDFVENPGSDNYYIMELLKGSTLSAVIDNDGIQPLERSVGIMLQVASALGAVHAAGIVHRDLKPDNVFLTERGGQIDFVKLLDFGVAKLGGDTTISVHSTAAGAILGTPEYMSPEQASGKSVDTRTDIYAFGVMLYELVTGRLPLTGSSFGELVVKHLTVAPMPPGAIDGLPYKIPIELEDVILACLAKEPDDRPESISAVAERLAEIADREEWPLSSFAEPPRIITGKMAVLAPLRKSAAVPAQIGPEPTQPVRALSAPTLDAPPRSRRWWIAGAAIAVAAVAVGVLATRGGDEVAPPPASPIVEIEAETMPAGAEVFRDGVSLGRTPTTLRFDRADREVTLAFRLPGYTELTHAIVVDRPSRVVLTLAREPAPEPPPAVVTAPTPETTKPTKPAIRKPTQTAKKKVDKPPPTPDTGTTSTKPIDRSGVLNPFEKKP